MWGGVVRTEFTGSGLRAGAGGSRDAVVQAACRLLWCAQRRLCAPGCLLQCVVSCRGAWAMVCREESWKPATQDVTF